MATADSTATKTLTLEEVCLGEIRLIPTSYGRLVYLAGLRNPNTGTYEHFGLTSAHGESQTNRALRQCHEAIFNKWVSFSLETKKADLDLYIDSIGRDDKVKMVDTWLRMTPYKNLVPGSFQGPERQKHISDFEAILGLLKNLYGVASPDPDA